MLSNEELYKTLLNSIDEGIYCVNKHNEITFWNKGAERITGFSSKEVLNRKCSDNILNHIDDEGNNLCIGMCPLKFTMGDGIPRENTVYLQHKKGHRIPVTIKTLPIKNGDEIVGAVETFNDNVRQNEIMRDIKKLKILATQDQLTDLPNRRYIDQYLQSKMHEFQTLGIPFGVMFIDIDNFKNINDTYGHDLGDEILKMVSKVFKGSKREIDVIGRWGGEEFIGVFAGVDEQQLKLISEKIRILIENSDIHPSEKDIKITISIGATISQKQDTLKSIIKRADKLLYKSKANGRNIVSIE